MCDIKLTETALTSLYQQGEQELPHYCTDGTNPIHQVSEALTLVSPRGHMQWQQNFINGWCTVTAHSDHLLSVIRCQQSSGGYLAWRVVVFNVQQKPGGGGVTRNSRQVLWMETWPDKPPHHPPSTLMLEGIPSHSRANYSQACLHHMNFHCTMNWRIFNKIFLWFLIPQRIQPASRKNKMAFYYL